MTDERRRAVCPRAVSDRSPCFALSVTSGTQRPLGSAGVSNYMLLSLTHARTHTSHDAEGWWDGTWHSGEHKHWTEGGAGGVISSFWWTWILTKSCCLIFPKRPCAKILLIRKSNQSVTHAVMLRKGRGLNPGMEVSNQSQIQMTCKAMHEHKPLEHSITITCSI